MTIGRHTPAEWGAAVESVLAKVRAGRPLVHHLTSPVVMSDTANVTLALGAAPVMAAAPEEVREVAAGADCLVLNLGILGAERLASMLAAAEAAGSSGVPIVLDPAGAGGPAFRTRAADELIGRGVAAVRGNAGEIAALAGARGAVRGVDSALADADPVVAMALARRARAVVAATGARDVVTDGLRMVRVANGHALLQRIAGGGCMATAVVACCVAVEPDVLVATVAGLAAYGIAAERAAARCEGPGSFRVALFDCVAGLSDSPLAAETRIDAGGGGAPS